MKEMRDIIGLPDQKPRPFSREWFLMSIDKVGRLALLLLAVSAQPALAGEQMKGGDIAAALSGITLDGIYNDRSYFTETYNDDGSIRYHDTRRSDTGQWSVKGDTFCTFYEEQSGACFYVVRDGENCFTFHEAVEGTDGKLGPRETWTSRGWNRAARDTCPTRPETEI